MARIARVVAPGACYVGRSLARKDRKRKDPKIKYGVPGMNVFLNTCVLRYTADR